MAHRFDYSNSDYGVTSAFDFLFLSMELAPLTPANSLFLGAGQITGSVTWPDGAGTASQGSHLGSNGAITTGTAPDPLFSRATQAFALPATFDASTDFTGLFTYTLEDGSLYVAGAARFVGQSMPVLNWDDTATGADEASALADFAANRDAAIADYAAQIMAVLSSTISGQIITSLWDLVEIGEPGQTTVTYTPDPNTTLTYGDLLYLSQDNDGRASLLADPENNFNASMIFGPMETVEVVLTRFDDWFDGSSGFSGAAAWIDAGAGNDVVFLFEPSAPNLTQTVSFTVVGGAGDDELVMSGAVATNMAGGEGQDRITGGSLADVLSGDAGDDDLTGGTGQDSLYGGTGHDLLDGGDQNDRLAGGTGNDTLLGGGSRDRILGGGGDDHILGGAGNDVITGGNGADTFVFAAGDGRDRVSDLTLLDRIELDAALWTGSVADFVAARVTVQGPGELRMATTATDFVVLNTSLAADDLSSLILFV